MATYTVTDEELTHTLYAIGNELKDQNTYPLPFLEEHESIHGKGTPSEEGGTKLIIPLNFGRHSVHQQLSTGYEPLNFAVEDVGTPATAEWGLWIQPVVISGKERRLNRGSHKVLDILENRSKMAMRGFMENFHKRIWGQTVSDFSDLETINGDDESDGFLEAVANGSQNNSVHGVSKSTYSSSLGWQNQYATGSGVFSANGLTALDSVMAEILSLKTDLSKHRIYATRSAHKNLKRALRANEQYVTQDTLDGGKQRLAWNGIPVIINRDLPTGGSATGSNPWSFVFVDHECILFKSQAGEYFRTGEMKERDGYDVTAAGIYLMGQLCTDYMGTSGLVTNCEAW